MATRSLAALETMATAVPWARWIGRAKPNGKTEGGVREPRSSAAWKLAGDPARRWRSTLQK